MTTPQAAGPSKGYIIGHGGGNIDKDLVFKERFLDLARGGMDSLVYIPTAFSDEQLAGRQKKNLDPAYAAARFGFVSAAVLHTRDRLTAGSGDFLAPLKTATAVFFTGGRQWRLVDAYLGTQMIDELEKLLSRGGVIGGSSAGITALASLLVRGNSSPDDNTILLGDHLEGFGLLSNMAVDQHLLEQERQDDMLQVIKAYPHVLGLGIDIMTSVVIQGNVMQVCGKSRVAVYDVNDSSDTGYIFLQNGDSYDLKKRKRLPSV